jgi:hypothetical protein
MRQCGKLNRYPAGVRAGPGKRTGAPSTLGHPSRLLTGPALTHTLPAIVGKSYQDLSAYSTTTLPVIFG